MLTVTAGGAPATPPADGGAAGGCAPLKKWKRTVCCDRSHAQCYQHSVKQVILGRAIGQKGRAGGRVGGGKGRRLLLHRCGGVVVSEVIVDRHLHLHPRKELQSRQSPQDLREQLVHDLDRILLRHSNSRREMQSALLPCSYRLPLELKNALLA